MVSLHEVNAQGSIVKMRLKTISTALSHQEDRNLDVAGVKETQCHFFSAVASKEQITVSYYCTFVVGIYTVYRHTCIVVPWH